MTDRRVGAGVATPIPRADPHRVAADIEALRRLTLPDRPYTRRAFTSTYAEGRRWLISAMDAAGLSTEIDAAGNLIGRSAAGHPDAVVIGSHIDTVPDGGAYDGVAGVVAGLEVARLLRQAETELPFTFEVVDFLSEEPSDFGISCIGSRAIVGRLSPQDLLRCDQSGRSLEEAIRSVGGHPEALGGPLREPGTLRAYLELHIEQGPVLEQVGAVIGIVTGIVGIRRYELRLEGTPTHAGTTPMDCRRDALAGAAELILAVERFARERAGRDGFSGTVGRLAVAPNASNVVPGETTVTAELRALSSEPLDEAQAELEAFAQKLAAERGLGLALVEISRSTPVELDSRLRALLTRTADATGAGTVELPSGGGHDAAHLAVLGPAAMLFIPCRGGLSHAPGESAEPRHIAAGADVLLRAVLELAERRS
jgi:beta-ureidopropionase / N-carbamoyl-L-amino-acid hydrolase